VVTVKGEPAVPGGRKVVAVRCLVKFGSNRGRASTALWSLTEAGQRRVKPRDQVSFSPVCISTARNLIDRAVTMPVKAPLIVGSGRRGRYRRAFGGG